METYQLWEKQPNRPIEPILKHAKREYDNISKIVQRGVNGVPSFTGGAASTMEKCSGSVEPACREKINDTCTHTYIFLFKLLLRMFLKVFFKIFILVLYLGYTFQPPVDGARSLASSPMRGFYRR